MSGPVSDDIKQGIPSKTLGHKKGATRAPVRLCVVLLEIPDRGVPADQFAGLIHRFDNRIIRGPDS